MATELRRIFLDPAELLAATQSYLRANVEIVGSVTVVSVQASKDGTLAVNFFRSAQTSQPEADVVLQRDQVLELLVRFCLENNIPLPRMGAKIPVACGDSLALQIKIGDPHSVDAFDAPIDTSLPDSADNSADVQ